MPELPEVETIKMDLEKVVVGTTISDFSSNSPKQIIPSINIVKKYITGAKIEGVERRAKLIILRTKNLELRTENFLVIHLKMTGRLLLRKKNDPPDPFMRSVFYLTLSPVIPTEARQLAGRVEESYSTDLICGRSLDSPAEGGLARDDKASVELRFCDTRKFGYIRLFKDKKELDNFLKDFGPEPLSDIFTVEYWQKVLANKSQSIKTCLMDQGIISGIGNIYANEALFLAKIKPTRSAKSLKFKEFKSLKESIITVLKKGISYRGSTARDESYRDLYGELGHYQNHFLVYQKQKCQKCQSVIKYQKISGRGTFWCPKCQK